MKYEEFLTRKAMVDKPTGIPSPKGISKKLFDFQQAATRWALMRGRAALFEGTGLGKTPQQEEWARHVEEHTKRPVLIAAPLGVTHQSIVIAKEILGMEIKFAMSQSDVGERGVYITNYQKIEKFEMPSFGGIVLDESSILKNSDGWTSQTLIDSCQCIPFRLACTATPAPNDYMEIGTHAEFLGVMTATEMLSTFFVHDGGETQKWRLKGHAETDFWKWMCSWAVCFTNPSEIGFDGSRFELPPLRVHEIIVDCESVILPGELFPTLAQTLSERRVARRESINERVEACAGIANGMNGNQILAWCNLNTEAEETAKAINAENVTGSDSDTRKESVMAGFANGEIKRVTSKPSMFGYGMNFQLCHTMFFIGLSDSWEQMYQAIRRCWRFGQKHPVDVYIVISSLEIKVLENIKRKDADAMRMQKELALHMADLTKKQLTKTQSRMKTTYKTATEKGENWTIRLGDCVEGIKRMEDNSIGFSVFSPPFASLYTYSASDRDMGNCKDDGEFMKHFAFVVAELFRVTQPGRLCSFHCMNMPTSKARDGYIGIRDFRGALIRLFEDAGWIYHSEVTIWKDPVTAMQRTKAIGLLHKQVVKDSCMSRQGIPDYLVTMRKPGVNASPVAGEFDEWIGDDSFESKGRMSIDVWQRYASPVWMDINPSDTLQFRSAREHADERHVCPLQLQVIERALEMWSNPGDLVYSPFTGIGSEGYVSIQRSRRFIGDELKESYFNQAVANLKKIEAETKTRLFA